MVAFAAVSACNRDRAPEPQTTAPAPTSTSAAAAPSSTPNPSAEHAPSERAVWADPPGWVRVPSSSAMRLATYHVPKNPGDRDDGEVSVFRFDPGKGGDVKANFERWQKQFSGVKPGEVRQSERAAGAFMAHLLEIDRGTFASGMPGEPARPSPGYGLLGAIVETPAGTYYFKLTGPEKTVKASKEAFFALLDSIKLGLS